MRGGSFLGQRGNQLTCGFKFRSEGPILCVELSNFKHYYYRVKGPARAKVFIDSMFFVFSEKRTLSFGEIEHAEAAVFSPLTIARLDCDRSQELPKPFEVLIAGLSASRAADQRRQPGAGFLQRRACTLV